MTLMLMDKGYYDYDYQRPSEKWAAVKESAKNDDELVARLARMGLKPRRRKPISPSPEEMQRIAMAEARK